MCGIAGYFGPDAISPDRLQATLTAMHHRGPDGSGQASLAVGDNHLHLLHTRLAIIDPEARSDQPFDADDCLLVFNGEIYNFVELREELAQLGHQFETTGDTEVIIKAYRAWGLDCISRFEGMFAFAIFDRQEHCLILARDGFGEKPLFIHQDGRGLYFASEIKLLRQMGVQAGDINQDRMERFLIHGYRALNGRADSFYENITPFPPGHHARLSSPADYQPRSYWQLTHDPQPMNWMEAVEGTKHHLKNAIKLRLRADTNVAITLSGGIDSNVLAAIAAHEFDQTIHSFSMLEAEIGYNEEPLINRAVEALQCDHHIMRVHGHDFMDRLARIVHQQDAPVPTIAMYLDAWLAESVSEAGYKVALNGMGSDELFSGYYDHYLYYLAGFDGTPAYEEKVSEWRASMGQWIRNPLLKDPHRFSREPGFRDHLYLSMPDIGEFTCRPPGAYGLERDYSRDLLRNRMLNELHHEAVPVYLLAGDHNWMAQSVESRSAYLDRDLARFLYSVPSELLFRDGRAKALLREAGRGLVPPEILDMSRKVGFNARITSLLYRDNPDVVERLMSDTPVFDILRRDRIEQLMKPDTPLEGYDNFLFAFASAQLFYLNEA
ncbi:asparagine synthase (glutamine-hydrolyzing) [Aestuariispira insulae]|uniref:asparagine synthase (glutamine-hydrolyzing) n=1 Tax=Aestuariispira insulae TaxID=1461337 RepID=A0A3D9HY62_9PROT|nr:asparagine synthase (glutamine-hydrolyzing) [Aestuariispira insulae]RED54355.1 asparagine synthase (glutamine-hydrolysing) [Aestuariispira insulae]